MSESPVWATPDALARELNNAINFADWAESLLEQRITRLEEIVAAPWWRRWLLQRELRGELRAVDRAYRESGGDFRARRSEAFTDELIDRVPHRRLA